MVDKTSSVNIRQLCLQLKPILGSKADKIYTAYMAEDKEGQQQIEHYLQLLTAKYLPSKLEQSTTVLLPPSEETAGGEYKIGTVKYAGKNLYNFGLREEEWIQHMAILGRSGAGKTNVGFLILQQLKQKNKPFLIFDWKRNYRDLLALPGFQDVEVYTIGRNITPFSFNPLIPPTGTNPKTWLKKLNEVIAHAYCLGNGVLFLLQQAVDSVYEEAGVYNGTVEKWPTFKDVLNTARSMDTRGRESGWLSSTLRALATLCFGDMDKLVNSSNNKSIDHILDKNIILELDALSQSDKTFFIQASLLYLHHKRMAEERREDFKHAIIIEESHHILSDERRSLVGGQSVMDIIFREIREFGESLILLDQHPSKISLYALGNTYCTICMNLKHKTDINAMSQCMLLDKEREILGLLDVGQAVVKLQGRIARPFQIVIPEFVIEKGKISDAYIKKHMQKIAPALPEDDFRLPVNADESNIMSKTTDLAENMKMAFLRDIQNHPESGIAERYKRLGISVRQGQKIKRKILKDGLIEEDIKTIRNGRIKVIRLTEKGWRFLNKQTK
ncbi:MAG: ATP-binding protein [Planctomycetota bacterium]|jgi:predicted transcriptional regulator